MPVKVTLTGWLYHPPSASAGRSAAALTSGAVASYLSVNEPEALFPAPSVHVPLIVAPPESGPLYVPDRARADARRAAVAVEREGHRLRVPAVAVGVTGDGRADGRWARVLGDRHAVAVERTAVVDRARERRAARVLGDRRPRHSRTCPVTPAGSYDHVTVTLDRNQPPQPPPLQAAEGGPALRSPTRVPRPSPRRGRRRGREAGEASCFPRDAAGGQPDDEAACPGGREQ